MIGTRDQGGRAQCREGIECGRGGGEDAHIGAGMVVAEGSGGREDELYPSGISVSE